MNPPPSMTAKPSATKTTDSMSTNVSCSAMFQDIVVYAFNGDNGPVTRGGRASGEPEVEL
jgi:hypothetical protein